MAPSGKQADDVSETAVCPSEISAVRSLLLERVAANPSLREAIDPTDLEDNITKADGMIRVFCRHHHRHHRQHSNTELSQKELSIVADRLLHTLRWRKEYGLAGGLRVHEFPMELFTQNKTLVYEDDDIIVAILIAGHDARITDHWSDLRIRFSLTCFSEKLIPAANAGKRIVVLNDARHISLLGLDVAMQREFARLIEDHFVPFFDVFASVGIPSFLAPAVKAFNRLFLPRDVARVLRTYTSTSVIEVFGNDVEKLPECFGGRLKMVNQIERIPKQPVDLREGDLKAWRLEEWEVEKVTSVLKSLD